MQTFKIQDQWEKFLSLSKLSKDRMPPIQYQMMKRSFFGGFGQCMLLMRDEVSELPEDEAINACEDMLNQVGDFWLKQSNSQN